MAITYTDINELTDLAPNEISNSSKIQLNSTSCATVSSLAEKSIMIAESNDWLPITIELPANFSTFTTDTTSEEIKDAINTVASNWSDFLNKLSNADTVIIKNDAVINENCEIINITSSTVTNTCNLIYIKSTILYDMLIYYNTSSQTYSCTKNNMYNISHVPKGSFRYQTSNVVDNVLPGDHILLVNAPDKIVINLKASDFSNTAVRNNHVCKIAVPGTVTTVAINTDNGIPALITDAAKEPSDFGGGTQDKIVYTITSFASSNSPNSSQIWFFVDAELYRLNA